MSTYIYIYTRLLISHTIHTLMYGSYKIDNINEIESHWEIARGTKVPSGIVPKI